MLSFSELVAIPRNKRDEAFEKDKIVSRRDSVRYYVGQIRLEQKSLKRYAHKLLRLENPLGVQISGHVLTSGRDIVTADFTAAYISGQIALYKAWVDDSEARIRKLWIELRKASADKSEAIRKLRGLQQS